MKRLMTPIRWCLAIALCTGLAWADAPSVTVGTFLQEVATVYTTQNGFLSDYATAIAVAKNGHVFAGCDKGLAEFDGTAWAVRAKEPVSALASWEEGVVGVVGKSVVFFAPGVGERPLGEAPSAEIRGIAGNPQNKYFYLATSKGLYRVSNGHAVPEGAFNSDLPAQGGINAVAISDKGAIAVAADSGLFQRLDRGRWQSLTPETEDGRSWAPRNVKAVAYDKAGRLWFGSPQGAGCLYGGWTLFTGTDGLPYNQFAAAACGPKGETWFATNRGAMRYEDANWNYRQGRRWVPSDDVYAVAVDDKGNAWFATAGGVGVIERRPMTFAEKAKFYEEEIDKYNRRTEYGYVLECSVANPGDKSSHTNSDSDNDGLWTSMYGAGECFAYAATKDPAAKARAKQAFEALRFLSVAPVGGEVKQQPGFVARTVIPTTERNPNDDPSYTIEGQKKDQEGDSLWKVYSPRWPLTKDKKYWYKTDTSSDELDGHYFFYAAYYEHVADTPEEKERLRKVVCGITDHLLRNDYCLIDHDGKPTRWAVYSPAKINHDWRYSWERGINSLSMLSYLTVAEHVSGGDPKYTKAIKSLCEVAAYDTNAINAKLQQGIGSGNQSDDEMAIMCFYDLIKYTKNSELKQKMQYAFYRYMSIEWPEMNPFFNFCYAGVGTGAKFTNAYRTWDMDPWDGWLDDSVDTLKRFPLDLFNWSQTNAHRLDIVRLPRPTLGDPVEPLKDLKRYIRGTRVSGKVIPVDERHFNHWNTDPFDLNYGGDGRGLADGAVYLLPYYMGLYHGFIKE